MKEYIKILKRFRKSPLSVLENDRDKEKLMAAIDESVELLQKKNNKKEKLLKTYY